MLPLVLLYPERSKALLFPPSLRTGSDVALIGNVPTYEVSLMMSLGCDEVWVVVRNGVGLELELARGSF